MAGDNKTLGNFRLDGIPPAPRGVPQIEVTFDIDANGILNVSAKDKATGKEQQIQITATTNLTEADVDRMVSEAKSHEAEDLKKRELIEARNQADQLIYTVEKTIKELADKVSEADKGQAKSLVEQLKQAMEGDDINRIRTLTEQLQQASYAFSQQLYQTQAAQGTGDGQTSGQTAPEDDDVVEGEFQEM
jgi:molecular chaperone DnaK